MEVRARGAGRIVNVSSGAAEPRVGIPLVGAYGASKAALHSVTYELVKELAPLGIDVVLVEGGVGLLGLPGLADPVDRGRLEGLARQVDVLDVVLAQHGHEDAAVRLASMAFEEGVRWFVCSPAEVRALREALGKDAVLVTPGVRPAESAKGDQKRVATPEQAIADGASWVVVGRPIRDAADRLAAARAIGASIANARASA